MSFFTYIVCIGKPRAHDRITQKRTFPGAQRTDPQHFYTLNLLHIFTLFTLYTYVHMYILIAGLIFI